MAVNKVIYNGNVLIDLSDSTVASEKVIDGVVTYDAKGNRIVGTMKQVVASDDGKGNVIVNGLSAHVDGGDITIGGK